MHDPLSMDPTEGEEAPSYRKATTREANKSNNSRMTFEPPMEFKNQLY
jgi:hypothetical protein